MFTELKRTFETVFVVIVNSILLSTFSGCAAHSMYEAGSLRSKTNSYYERQIVENLARASQGRPFVHTNIDSMYSTVRGKAAGSFQGGESGVNTGVRGISGTDLAITATRAVTRPLLATFASEYEDTINTTAKPEVRNADAYIPYLKFLNLRNSSQRLQSVKNFDLDVNSAMPALGRAQGAPTEAFVPGTVVRIDGTTYYIPLAFRQAYFDLSLALIAKVEASVTPVGTHEKGTGSRGKARRIISIEDLSGSRTLKDIESKLDQLRSLVPR